MQLSEIRTKNSPLQWRIFVGLEPGSQVFSFFFCCVGLADDCFRAEASISLFEWSVKEHKSSVSVCASAGWSRGQGCTSGWRCTLYSRWRHSFKECTHGVCISVADPWYSGTSPDPRIRTSDWIRILLFRQWPSERQHKKFFFANYFAY